MKILHTSDWHLGAVFDSRKRYEEFDKVLDFLLKVIREEHIEAVIIAGDVFDSNLPSNRATEQYYNFLVSARDAGVKNLIVTAGNHDSASFLEAPAHVLKKFAVHVSGKVDSEKVDSAIIPLQTEDGAIAAVVCAVPYLRDSDIRRAVSGEDIEAQENRRLEGVIAWYEKVCARAEELYPGVPLIATGHFYADEVNYYKSLQAVPVSRLPENIDYLALGHLHVPQQIEGKINARYSGALLQMDFKDFNDIKKLLILDSDKLKEDPVEVMIPCFQRIEKISGTLDELREKIEEFSKCGESVWVYAFHTGDFEPRLSYILSGFCANTQVSVIKCDNQQMNPALTQYRRNADEPVEITPQKLFARVIENMSDERKQTLTAAFMEACRLLENEEDKSE